MKAVYNDNTLQLSRGDFEKPEAPLSVEINCSAAVPADENSELDYDKY
jgi:hypothetical protein